MRLVHLEWEEVEDPAEIRHPILRAAIARHWNGRPLDLSSAGDVPPGTGLGSSGAYAVCAVKALEVASGRDPSRPSWPRRRARSSWATSAARSASRISTRPRTAA